MNGAQTEQVVEPRTTGELFRYIGKKLPKQILKALPVTIAVAVVSWLVHTYLIVGPNGGFAPDTWLANNILNVKGKLISSTFLWALLGGVITMFVSSLIQGRNPFKSLAEMIKVPGNIFWAAVPSAARVDDGDGLVLTDQSVPYGMRNGQLLL